MLTTKHSFSVFTADTVPQKLEQAMALHRSGQLIAAKLVYEDILKLHPDHADALHLLGMIALHTKDYQYALDLINKAISLVPDNPQFFSNQGNALRELNQLDAAIASYDNAIAVDPNYVDVYYNRGSALHDLKQLNAAMTTYDQAIALKPDYADVLFSKSLTLLLNADFDHGWKLYEWRWKMGGNGLIPRIFSQPRWLGDQSLAGKTILLHSEQGLGDTLQFCRYAKLVSALGGRVILEVPAVLIGLLTRLEGVAQLIESGKKLPDFDYYCPLLSLPLAFKTTLKNIPSAPSYLQVNTQKRDLWSLRLGAKVKPRIGLVWNGSVTHKKDRSRSFSLTSLLAYLPDGFQYICLQKELRDIDKATLATNKHILFFGNRLKDFDDTAALCDLMDLVISVDTSIAHLAGALGKETWILLPFVPDWRWLLDREDSPWYPTIRLYRQPALYDWQSVLQKLHVDLLTKMNLTPSAHQAK